MTIEGLLFPEEFNDFEKYEALRVTQAAGRPISMMGWAVGGGMAADLFGRVIILTIEDTQCGACSHWQEGRCRVPGLPGGSPHLPICQLELTRRWSPLRDVAKALNDFQCGICGLMFRLLFIYGERVPDRLIRTMFDAPVTVGDSIALSNPQGTK